MLDLTRKIYPNVCPLCRFVGTFETFNRRWRAKCPSCGSLERHRLQWLYYVDVTKIVDAEIAVLHVAPEVSLFNALNGCLKLNYTAVDLEPVKRGLQGKIEQGDLLNLQHETNTFDLVICNHVLEHVEDDVKALREIFRVLKPGADAVLQVPINGYGVTDEGKDLTTPEQRLERFGQKDHVRLYGTDYAKRLESAGFQVTVDNFVQEDLTELEQTMFGLMPIEKLYIGAKC